MAVSDVISESVLSAQLGQYGDISADDFRKILQDQVTGMCGGKNTWGAGCSDAQAEIDSAVSIFSSVPIGSSYYVGAGIVPDNSGLVSYNPSAGYVVPAGSLPPEASPTIPAYTSPANVAVTSPGNPTASAGGSSVAGTAAGAGPTSGGSNSLQSPYNPDPGVGPSLASLSQASQNSKLLMILLAIAVAVIFFGRH